MSEYSCPLRVVVGTIRDGGQARPRLAIRIDDCGAPLHLVWHHDWLIDPEVLTLIDATVMPEHAYTDWWEVVCENGHTVARSYADPEADGSAVAFDPVAVMGALGAPITDSVAADVEKVIGQDQRTVRHARCWQDTEHGQHFYDVNGQTFECSGTYLATP